MITIETKVTIQATKKDVEPLQNFLGWLEEMDNDVVDACNEFFDCGLTLDSIYTNLSGLLNNIEIW